MKLLINASCLLLRPFGPFELVLKQRLVIFTYVQPTSFTAELLTLPLHSNSSYTLTTNLIRQYDEWTYLKYGVL